MLLRWMRRGQKGNKTKTYEGKNHKLIVKILIYNVKYYYNNTYLYQYFINT